MELTKKEQKLVLEFEKELDDLYVLTELDALGGLTKEQEEEYVLLVNLLQDNKVPIQFGIEI